MQFVLSKLNVNYSKERVINGKRDSKHANIRLRREGKMPFFRSFAFKLSHNEKRLQKHLSDLNQGRSSRDLTFPY